MPSPEPARDALNGMETLEDTMSAPAAGELVFAVDAARRAGTVARWLLGEERPGLRPGPARGQ